MFEKDLFANSLLGAIIWDSSKKERSDAKYFQCLDC